MKRFALALAALGTFASAPAYAGVNINAGAGGSASLSAGQSFDINFNGFSGNVSSPSIIPGLSALLKLTFVGQTTVSGNTVFNFLYALTNTSTLKGTRISSFGFNVDPDAIAAAVTGKYDTVQFNANYPVGFGTVDVCFFDTPAQASSQGATCTGNGTGVTRDGTVYGTIALTVAGLVENLAITDLVDRYQAFDFNGTNSAIGVPGGVPEPATWAMMMLGIGLAGAAMRRRQKVSAKISFA